ncbi:hypothetical protein JXQ31_03370 [candidate division KSB1 bacterium]|nr:hypothetical protein [candidate division KSB1 bacterium]
MLKNITLSAEEEHIQKARDKARREHTSLNNMFRQWLKQVVNADKTINNYDSLMNSFHYVSPGKKFSRDEMNER